MARRLALVMACILAAGSAGATTYVLSPDGTGDFPDLQAALIGVVDGDVIELTAGTYGGDGNHDVDFLGKAVTVRRQNGVPGGECLIDLSHNGGFLFALGEGPGSVLEGLTLVNGYRHDGGGAILVVSSSPTIRNCVFSDNEGSSGGGAVLCASASPSITGCRFRNCLSVNGGGLGCIDGSAPVVTDCIFETNTGTYGGAVASFGGSAPALTGCRLTGNVAWTDGGALYAEGASQPSLSGCTLDANTAALGSIVRVQGGASLAVNGSTLAGNTGAACLGLGLGSGMTLDRTIVALEANGVAVQCEGADAPVLTCCDLSGNAGGDWTDCIADQLGTNGNLASDPLFCDPAQGDWTLHLDSPCGSSNPHCGQIGAWPVGCGPSPAEPTSWGEVKARFRP